MAFYSPLLKIGGILAKKRHKVKIFDKSKKQV